MHEWDPVGPLTLLNLTTTSIAVTGLFVLGASYRCDVPLVPLTKITNFKIITIISSNFFLFYITGN